MLIRLILLLVFFAATICVGLYFRKRASDVDGFVLGGRSVSPWLTALSYGSTYFSAVVFVGYAGQFGWKFGSAAVWIGLGNAFIGSLMPWVILGRRTRVMTKHLDSKTMPDFFGIRYGSDNLKIFASILAFIFLTPYAASLYKGLSMLFSMAFDIDYSVCIIAMAVITAVFVILGGYFATIVNDSIQAVIMLIGIVAVIAAVLSFNGGFTAAVFKLAEVSDPAYPQPGVFTSFFGPDPINLIGVILLTSFGTWGLPQLVSRFYSIKSENLIRKGTIISTVFAIVVSCGCYFLGSFGRLYPDAMDKGSFDGIVPFMLAALENDLIIGLVVLLALAASISTLSSLVMVAASTFTMDFLKGKIIKKMDDKTQLFTIRMLVIVFILISTLIAIVQNANPEFTLIAQLMGISWGALAGSFLAPFIYGLYWKKATKASIWCNFIFAASFMIANIFFKSAFPAILQSSINAGAFVMLAGLAIVPAVSVFTKAPDKKKLDAQFSCYK